MSRTSRIVASLTAVVLVGVLAACSSSKPKVKAASSTKVLTGGTTTVVLDDAFVAQLTALKLTPSAYGTAKLAQVGAHTQATLPITSGSLIIGTGDQIAGLINHNGSGLTFTSGTTQVTVQKFVIHVGTTASVTAEVDLNTSVAFKSLTVFDLDTSTEQKPTVTGAGVELQGGKLYLSSAAASDLNAALGTTALAGGKKVLIGTVDVKGTAG